MATIVQILDKQTDTVLNMYSADARELMALASSQGRYEAYTAKGRAALASKPEKIDSIKPEAELLPADITQAGRGQGIRGGGEIPVERANQPRVDAPTQPQILPEQPAAVPADSPAAPAPSLVAGIAGEEAVDDSPPGGSDGGIPDLVA